MACRSTLTLCALFSVALLIFIATATIRPAHATSSPQPHKAASTCETRGNSSLVPLLLALAKKTPPARNIFFYCYRFAGCIGCQYASVGVFARPESSESFPPLSDASLLPRALSPSPSLHKGCCCAPRNKLPVTKSVYFKTKTVTVIKTVTSKKKLAARKDSSENYDHPSPVSEVAQDTDLLDSAASAGPLHSLFARHLCPVCPSGVSILPATKAAAAGAKKNAGSFNYCCPKRKTLTKTIKKTLTKRKTRTTTVAPVSFR